jgi:hypothetical protein
VITESRQGASAAGRVQRTWVVCLTFAWVIASFGLAPRSAWGQAYSSSLSGVVTDPQGAAIPRAQLELRNTATNEVRRTVATSDGHYIFSELPPGTYNLTVTAQGFKKAIRSGETLLANRAASLDVSLQVGSVQQSVEVTSQAPLLDTRSANETATLTERMVTALPTYVNNPFALVLTQAGATLGVMGQMNATLDQNYSGFDLNGGRSMSSEILVDGASDKAVDWGGLIVAPPTNTIQEMQIVSNTYDAQYGRSGGGVLSLITKGGTNQFHGTAYEFLQSEILNATSWSNNQFVDPGCSTFGCNRAKKPVYTLNQFGGDFGGPLWKSKHVFFFGAYDGLRQPAPDSLGPITVPTAAERNGDFSAAYNPNGTLQVLYNPFSTRPDPNNPGQYIRDPFDPSCVGVVYPQTCPGNVIPPSMMSSVGKNVMALFPSPTTNGDPITHENNYFKTASGTNTNNHVDLRIDWDHNDKHTMFGRWTQRYQDNQNTPCFFCNGADSDLNYVNPGYQFVLGNTFTPSPNWAVSVLLSTSRWSENQISKALGKLTAADIGLNATQYQAPLVPSFGLEGYAGLGPQFSQRIQSYIRYTNALEVNATWEKGSHNSIEFGGVIEPDLINNIDSFSGAFSFGRGFTSGPIAATDSSTTGNALASLLLGTTSYGQTQFQPDIASKLPYYALYGQDTWQASRRLTVILGLRYEVQPGATERFNRLASFDPNVVNPISQQVGMTVHGGMVYASPSNRRAWPTDWSNLAPRVGFAYRASDKLVLRSGFGIFYVPASSLYTFDYPGEYAGFSSLTVMNSSVGGGGLIPQNLIDNPFPNGLVPITGSSQGLLTFLGSSPFQTWLTGPHPTGYKMNWSFDIQYELHPGTSIDVGYLGYGARKLVFGNPSLNMNQLPDQYLSMGSALDQLVPNPFYGVITTGPLSGPTISEQRLLRPFPEFDTIQPTRSLPGATNNYNAFNVQFRHEFSSGLSVISSYQWSKNLDNASEDQGWAIFETQWRDYYNRNLEYSVSSHDIPQNFVTSLVYNLPVGRGRRFGAAMPKVADYALGGWQVAGIVTMQSGYPILVQGPGNLGNYGFGRTSPDLVSSAALYYPGFVQTPNRWFNSCTLQQDGTRTGCISASEPVAWIIPPNFTIGNAPRYNSNLRTGGTHNFDLSLTKQFALSERMRLQFRGEFLNAFNTPTYGGPDSSGASPDAYATDGSFGRIFGTANLPRIIQFSMELNF